MTKGRSGLLYAVAAYGTWALAPIYWKQLSTVPIAQLLAHRVLWCAVLVSAVLTLRKGWPALGAVLRQGRARWALVASTALIATNWFTFMWAVNNGKVLATSLGYYMNPLLNVLLGRFVLGETLSRARLGAVLLAAVGVANLALHQGGDVWVSLTLASTFAAYGLIRKTAPVSALTGLAFETGLLMPAALLFLWFTPGALVQSAGLRVHLLLLGSGVLTAVPLFWFAMGAQRLTYSTLGVVQYLAPTGQFLVAVLLYGEAFTLTHALTFACIWSAVALYAFDSLRRRGLALPAVVPAAE